MAPRLLMSLRLVTTTRLFCDAAGIGSGLRDVHPACQILGAAALNPVLVKLPDMPAACPWSLTSTSSAMAWRGAGRPSSRGLAVRDCQTTALSRSGSVLA